jgi:hypothetical protein
MAVNFDGVNDYADLTSGATLDNLDPWSSSFWLYNDTLPGNNQNDGILIKSATGLEVYQCYVDTDAGGNTAIWTTVGHATSSSFAGSVFAPFAADTWNHIVTIFDSTLANDQQIFINGVETVYNAGGGPSAGVGARNSDAAAVLNAARDASGGLTDELDGFMEDVRIYNRRLSAEEIQTIHACRGTDGIVSGMVSCWGFDELEAGAAASGAGNLKDASPNANHGTGTSGPNYTTGVIRSRRKMA